MHLIYTEKTGLRKVKNLPIRIEEETYIKLKNQDMWCKHSPTKEDGVYKYVLLSSPHLPERLKVEALIIGIEL